MKNFFYLLALCLPVLAFSSCGSDDDNNAPDVPVTDIETDLKTKSTMNVGDTWQVEAKAKPDNATNKTLRWSSDNEKVATVSQTGLITALSAGEVMITVSTLSGNVSLTHLITVKNASRPYGSPY